MNRHLHIHQSVGAFRFLTLAGALTWGLAFSSPTAFAAPNKGKGGGGGGGGILLARILFDPGDAVRSDGVQACDDPGDPIGPWDYWDWRDAPLANPDGDPNTPDGCDAGCSADVSKGGRLHFGTINLAGSAGPDSSPRWLVLDFHDVVDGLANPDIDSLYEGGVTDPPYDPDDGIDNVKTTMSLDGMFKSSATRNTLVINMRNCDDETRCYAVPAGYSLNWVEDLYIQETPDPDVRILTTDGTDALADLFYDDDGKSKTPPIHVGRYVMPIHWTMRLVP